MEIQEDTLLARCVRRVLGKHDETHVYQLPFLPWCAFYLVQGYGGSHSHFGSMHYCLDFAMPVGTAICAARSGIVIDVIDHFELGGNDPSFKSKWNVVTILHPDGSLATYGHLMKNGARVSKNQSVLAGEIICYSGNTGWSTVPHLHFHVAAGHTPATVPTRFATHWNKAHHLEEGRWYARRSPWDRLASLFEYVPNVLILSIRLMHAVQK